MLSGYNMVGFVSPEYCVFQAFDSTHDVPGLSQKIFRNPRHHFRVNKRCAQPMKPETDELLPTRWTLVERLKNWDDQESWRQFFDTYWRLIYGVALKAGLTESEAQEEIGRASCRG